MRASAFMGVSLDGYIARPDGALDWLEANPDSTEDYGYAAFVSTVDAVIAGRKTYEKMAGFPEWPFPALPVYVLSRTMSRSISTGARVHVEQDLPALVGRLEREGCQHIYVDGGQTVQEALRCGVLTDITITRLPVLLGAGIPAFADLAADIHLRHVETRAYSSGYVQSHYEIAGNLGK